MRSPSELKNYKLTPLGKDEVDYYLKECEAKRKEILNAMRDSGDNTTLPDIETILFDIAHFIDDNREYCNGWGVTDHYDADYPLYLKEGVHFVENEVIL